MATAKNWTFTLNNPTAPERAALYKLADHPDINYIVFQLEEGEAGTPHYQGMCDYVFMLIDHSCI